LLVVKQKKRKSTDDGDDGEEKKKVAKKSKSETSLGKFSFEIYKKKGGKFTKEELLEYKSKWNNTRLNPKNDNGNVNWPVLKKVSFT
jgi:hypothetical protein